MGTLAAYKKSWDRIETAQKVKREKLRKEAMEIGKRLKDILVKEFSVKKVVLFGSVLETGRFKEDSDIDIGVEGLPKRLYFRAYARLMMKSPFAVIIPLQSCCRFETH